MRLFRFAGHFKPAELSWQRSTAAQWHNPVVGMPVPPSSSQGKPGRALKVRLAVSSRGSPSCAMASFGASTAERAEYAHSAGALSECRVLSGSLRQLRDRALQLGALQLGSLLRVLHACASCSLDSPWNTARLSRQTELAGSLTFGPPVPGFELWPMGNKMNDGPMPNHCAPWSPRLLLLFFLAFTSTFSRERRQRSPEDRTQA